MASVDLTAIAVAITGGVFSTVAIIVPIWLRSKMNSESDARILSAALVNSLGAVQQAATSEIRALRPQLPGVPEALAPGVSYVLDQAGPEAERLGLTPAAIAQKIEAKIGLKNMEMNLAVTASPAPVVVAPLDPVPATVPQPAIIIGPEAASNAGPVQ